MKDLKTNREVNRSKKEIFGNVEKSKLTHSETTISCNYLPVDYFHTHKDLSMSIMKILDKSKSKQEKTIEQKSKSELKSASQNYSQAININSTVMMPHPSETVRKVKIKEQ